MGVGVGCRVQRLSGIWISQISSTIVFFFFFEIRFILRDRPGAKYSLDMLTNYLYMCETTCCTLLDPEGYPQA
jgi:hypothetical protein